MSKLNLLVVGILMIMSIPVSAQEAADTLNSNQQIIDIFRRGKHHQDSVKHYQDSVEQAAKERCKPGYLVPNFQFLNVDGRTVSLKDFEGDYVFIDVWATWCAPCRGEIPHLQKLEKFFQKKKIVFVSISIDEDVDDWKRMVKEKELGGVQLILGSDKRLTEEFGILTIPRFILLDQEGRIIDAYMTRPSEEVTRERVEKLKGI